VVWISARFFLRSLFCLCKGEASSAPSSTHFPLLLLFFLPSPGILNDYRDLGVRTGRDMVRGGSEGGTHAGETLGTSV
jgi:hypothetical protein